jgi:enterochelin esterase-like enzyme
MKHFWLTLATAFLAFCTLLPAQQQQQQQGPPGQAQIPPYQVLPDNRITFQLKAPDASKVELRGDWPGGLGGNTTVPMAKDDKGLWTVTAGPLQSDAWNYTFIVDGVNVPPAQANLVGTVSALPPGKFVIPGAFGDDFAPHDTPHGSLTYLYVHFGGLVKSIEVYTPAEYVDNPAKRYPVLYISGYADQWERQVNLHYLLDNMIASGRSKSMIAVVLDPQGGFSLGNTPYPGGGAQTNMNFVKGAQLIADELIPQVDKAFRTIADRDHRAITGFSSPGSLGFMAGANNPDKFAYIAAFSGGFPTWPDVGVRIETKLDPKQFGGPDLNRVPDMAKLGALIPKLAPTANFKLVYLSYGASEPLVQTRELLLKMLDERGVKYLAPLQPGYIHEWRFMRWSLRDFLPKIFE